MKRIIFIFIVLFAMSVSLFAQVFEAPAKSSKSFVAFTDTTTTYKYKISDNTYEVYKSKNNAYYIWKISKKTGKPYKMYLPKKVQIQMGRKYEDK